MHIWYASDDQTFQQYGIYEGQDQWVFQREWAGFNGHAGVGCYSWLPGTGKLELVHQALGESLIILVSYAMLVNLNNTVDVSTVTFIKL